MSGNQPVQFTASSIRIMDIHTIGIHGNRIIKYSIIQDIISGHFILCHDSSGYHHTHHIGNLGQSCMLCSFIIMMKPVKNLQYLLSACNFTLCDILCRAGIDTCHSGHFCPEFIFLHQREQIDCSIGKGLIYLPGYCIRRKTIHTEHGRYRTLYFFSILFSYACFKWRSCVGNDISISGTVDHTFCIYCLSAGFVFNDDTSDRLSFHDSCRDVGME